MIKQKVLIARAAHNAADPRPLFRVGASFSSKTGTVEEWQTE
jgi:hypothetical protein